jgi:Domain of unknown function (DUF4173)
MQTHGFGGQPLLPPNAYVPLHPLPEGANVPAHVAPPPIAPARPIELAVLVAMVVLFDVATYDAPGGAGFAALLLGLPALALVAARERLATRRGAALGALVVLAAARCAWQWSGATSLVGLGLVLAFAIALRTTRSFVPELVVSQIGSAFGSFRELWNFGRSGVALARSERLAKVRWLAFFVPLGLVVVFGGVFAAANPVVARLLKAAIGHLPTLAWFPSPLRFFFWGLCALAAAGLLRPVSRELAGLDARLGPGDALAAADEESPDARITLARNGMLALNVLFAAYNALDAVYLWIGRAPSGVSHTDYAHGGAAWLTVALVMSTIALGVLFRGPLATDPKGKLARALGYAWAGQNLVLAAGTFRRITMYVSYSGLTSLRIVGMFGTALATAGLAIVVVKLVRRRTVLWVLRRQLDALALAVALYAVTPTGWIAMHYNVARVEAAQYRPLLHLFQQPLTPEAVPELLALTTHADPTVADGATALLLDEEEVLALEDAAWTRWSQWEASRGHARAALADARERLHGRFADGEARQTALAKLRGVAYGINDEVEREGDDAPFDWSSRRYPARY